MKVYDLHDAQGRLRAFEIDVASISRGAVIGILKSVPGLVVKRSLPWYRFDKERFCEFEFAGSAFEVSEPNDDRSRFLIGSSLSGSSPQVDIVKSAFLRHSTPRWIVPLRILCWVLLGLGSLAFVLSRVLDPSLPDLDGVAFWSGGMIFTGMLLAACNLMFHRRNAG